MSAVHHDFIQRRLQQRIEAREPSAVPDMFGLQTAAGRDRMISALAADYRSALTMSRGHQAFFVRGAARFVPPDMMLEAFGDTSHLDDVPDEEVSAAMIELLKGGRS
jgi:hypothetical protein